MMTKRRIHTIYYTLCLFYTLAGSVVFLFYRRDFSKQDRCRLYTVLTKTAYFAVPILFFSTGSVVMFFNYVIIICNLTRSKISMRDATSGTIAKIPKNNVKLTRAIIMTLTAYIVLFIPVIAVTSIGTFFDTFIGNTLFDILEDVSLLFYFSNNFVNPFIYYMTLRDFRDGYNRLLFCCKRHTIQEKSPIRVVVI